MKNDYKEIAFTLFCIIYILPSLVGFVMGFAEANYGLRDFGCTSEWQLTDYIYPAYRMGCFLNGPK